MLKVGLVGVGVISTLHIPAWLSLEDVELVALCDIRPEQMEKYPNIRQYTDFYEMIEKEKLDVLDVCVPTYLHAEFSIAAMEKGINVLCEKPISLDEADISRMYEAAEKNKVKLMIAQVLRFWREYSVVKSIYDSKKYGKLLSGTMTRLGGYPATSWDGWLMDEKRSGLVPFDLHIHDLDFLVYAFGKPKNKTSFRAKRPEQDFINIVYEFDDFFIGTEASWYASPYPFTAHYRFQFENAVVSCEAGGFKIHEKDGAVLGLQDVIGEFSETKHLSANAYLNEILYFLDCVKNNIETDKVKPCELEAVIKTLKEL